MYRNKKKFTVRLRLLCGAYVVWDCLFTTGYPGFGVPAPLFIGYLISNLIFLKKTTGDKCSFGVLGHLQVMGHANLYCPEIPSRRTLADESPGQPTTMDNLPHAHHHPRNANN